MYQKIICVFCTGLFTVMPIFAQAASTCANPAGKIISAQGGVDFEENESGNWHSVKMDDVLCPGLLRTGGYSRVTVHLTNGSVISLPENSTITLGVPSEPEPSNEQGLKSWFVRLLNGVVLVRSRQPQRTIVDTPFINAVHEGTEFMVAVSGQQAEISVFDGKVRGKNHHGSILIAQGQKGVASAGAAPRVQALTVKPEDAVQWALYYPPVIDFHGQSEGALKPALDTFRQGRITDALVKLEQLPESGDSNKRDSLRVGLLLMVGKLVEAEETITRMGDDSDALALKSVIAVAKNRQAEALELANAAVQKNPQSAAAKIAQSYAYQSLFDLDKARQAAEAATTITPGMALAWARLAELQLSQGERAEALVSAQKAQALNPKFSRTQTVLGFAHLAKTDTAAAQQDFKQALTLDSSDPLARLGLGLAKIRQGEVEDGKNDLEAAVNLDPDNAIIRSYLGKAYYELRNKDYAGKEYEIAKAMDPKDPTPYFYDAILKQTINRPVEALHDMQKAIELNDNRGVYRSKFLLDKDEATRQVGLGRIFNNLGADNPAHRQSIYSLANDPGNYSAHRLLSDSVALQPRQEIARASEHFQSQLLQPLSHNPIQPSLAYTDLNIVKGLGPSDVSFNEYHRLFDRNSLRLTATGIGGSNSTFGDETALSGLYDKFSFSLGQLHYDTDGFRKNNDLKHNIYNAFAQYEFSPAVSVQAEYRHRETEHGDLVLAGAGFQADESYRRNLEQDTYRVGLKISPNQHSNFLFSGIYADRREQVNQLGLGPILAQSSDRGFNLESQYQYHNEWFSTVLGGAAYLRNLNLETSGPDLCFFVPFLCVKNKINQDHYVGYWYSTAKFFDQLNVTAGLSYDSYQSAQPAVKVDLSELNPKLGILWQVNRYLSFRAAGFKAVKSNIVVNQFLQPTQIAGFNQFYDDLTGSVAWNYGVGMDAKLNKNLYLGAEAVKRDLTVPITDFGGVTRYKRNEEVYRFYLNWLLSENWVVNSEYRFENFRSGESALPKSVETSYLPLSLRYFHDWGLFSEVKGTWVHQSVTEPPPPGESFTSSFILLDAALGYRLPKSYGLISVEVKNLLDKQFQFRDRQFQMNEQRTPDFIPERTFFVRATLNW